ncbi:MAG: caspase family protein [Gammaproteobacteria bacterium]|nr:caspase family protein [Gammaproteobacteria bacterium]
MYRLPPLLLLAFAFTTAQAACELTVGFSDNGNWQQQANSCPASPVAVTNAIIEQLNRGEVSAAQAALQQALQQFPDFAPLKELQHSNEQPFNRIAHQAEQLLQHWLDNYPQPAFNHQPPQLSTMPPLPELVKGEFETTTQFQQRVQQAQRERESNRQQLQQQYDNAVTAYNRAIAEHNRSVAQAQQQRRAEMPQQRQRALAQALHAVMGAPRLIDISAYDADRQILTATLVSSRANWQQPLTIQLPLAVARDFKAAALSGGIEPVVNFAINADRLTLTGIELPFQQQRYAALPSDGNTTRELAAVSVKLQESAPLQQSLAPVNAIASLPAESDSSYFNDALKMENDPQLAKLQQQQAELQRQQQQAIYQQQLAAERQRLEQENRRISEQLAQMGGDTSLYEGLQMKTAWQFPAAVNPQRDTIAVIFASREYGKGIPAVPYALNDAHAVKQYVETTLGLPTSQIIYQENPTLGQMSGTLNSILPSRLQATGATKVLLYFSGHGMTADNDAMLLPSDSSPQIAKDTGYSRTHLLSQLAKLDVEQVTVILDACYSGTDKGGRALLAGKPIFTPPDVAQLPAKITLMTASSSQQIAWMDSERGHSLFTYHLLRGLSGDADSNGDRQISRDELQRYLKREVNQSALLLHNSEQTPEVKGQRAVVASY